MSDETDSPTLRIALLVLAVLILLYSIVVATRPLLGVTLVTLLFVAYLAWRFLHLAARFVATVERIADATEAREG